MVSARGFVTNKIITVGIIVGGIAVAAYVLRKTDAGGSIIKSLEGFGNNAAQAFIAPFTGFVKGTTEASSGLGTAAVSLSEGFQKSVSATLGGGSNVFSEFGKVTNTSTGASNTTSTATTTVKSGVSTKSTNPVPYSAAAQVEQRAVNVVRASSNVRTVAFGGYGTAKAQEDALQAALAQAKAKYPQYYGVTT